MEFRAIMETWTLERSILMEMFIITINRSSIVLILSQCQIINKINGVNSSRWAINKSWAKNSNGSLSMQNILICLLWMLMLKVNKVTKMRL